MLFNNSFLRKPLLSRRLYFRLLLSFIILSIVIVLTISIIFSSIYINSLNTQLSVASINNLVRLNSEFDSAMNHIININAYLRENRDINNYLLFSDTDYMGINRANTYLKQLQYSSNFIHSIYIYNSKNELLMSSGQSHIEIAQFLKGNLHRPVIRKSDLNMVFCAITPSSFKGNNSQANSLETLSFIFPDEPKKLKGFENAIIINIDKEEIQKKLLGQLQ